MTGIQNVIDGIAHFLSSEFAEIQKVLNPVAAQVYAAFKTSVKGNVSAFIAAMASDFTAGKTYAEVLAHAEELLVTDGVNLAHDMLEAFLKALQASFPAVV